jgi:signal transduction histidine kinase
VSDRVQRLKPYATDLALGAAVLAATVAWTLRHDRSATAAGLALAVVQSLPLLVRRQRPLLVLSVIVAASAVASAFGDLPPFASALALYTVAAHLDRRRALQAGLLALVALAAPLLRETGYQPGDFVFHIAAFGAAWLVGDNVRTRRAYYRELEARAERLEREREENARRAVAEEQARIARELHDVIAHNVSVMVVQATAANDVFDTHPERARDALRSIEATGRSALTELRRLLGVVRPSPHERRQPQPGLASLGALLEQVRATGLEVDLELEGELDDLPAGLDLSAYRIVQEALTNTLKHAHAHAVSVRLERRNHELEVEVRDDGVGTEAQPASGQGLIGMRERASLVGGVLESGPADDGGFVVRARFPLGREQLV